MHSASMHAIVSPRFSILHPGSPSFFSGLQYRIRFFMPGPQEALSWWIRNKFKEMKKIKKFEFFTILQGVHCSQIAHSGRHTRIIQTLSWKDPLKPQPGSSIFPDLQARYLVRVPLPQDALHFPHSAHSPQKASDSSGLAIIRELV